MTDNGDEVNAIISGKAGLRHAGEAMDAMRAVANAHKKRSLKAFEDAIRTYAAHLRDDPLVAHHLDALYDILLQANICRIIEPFSRCARRLSAAHRAAPRRLRARARLLVSCVR
jgi:26S proteasome regulatory subunit N6